MNSKSDARFYVMGFEAPAGNHFLLQFIIKINMPYLKPGIQILLQADTSRRPKPPVDFKTKVPLWPGLFLSRREVLDNVMSHPVHSLDTESGSSLYAWITLFGWSVKKDSMQMKFLT